MDTFLNTMDNVLYVIGRTAWIALIALLGLMMSTMFLGVIMQMIDFFGGSLHDVAALVIWSVLSIGSLVLCFSAYYD